MILQELRQNCFLQLKISLHLAMMTNNKCTAIAQYFNNLVTRSVKSDRDHWFFLHCSCTVFPKQSKGIVLRTVNSDRDREFKELRNVYHCQERTVILSVDQDT